MKPVDEIFQNFIKEHTMPPDVAELLANKEVVNVPKKHTRKNNVSKPKKIVRKKTKK